MTRTRTWLLAALCCIGAHAGAQQPAAAPGAAGTAGAPAASASRAAAPAPAPGLYNVEVIVFRAVNTIGGPEDWGVAAGRQSAVGDAEGDVPSAPSSPAQAGGGEAGGFVRTLPASEFQLTGIEARLRASGSYVPVAHAAWSQTATPWGVRAGIPVQRLGLDAAGLSGSVALERGQFLHLDLDLNYAMANPPDGLGAAPGTVFTLRQNHRVRFYERNYFDHPAFGVIALVMPAQGARRAGR